MFDRGRYGATAALAALFPEMHRAPGGATALGRCCRRMLRAIPREAMEGIK